MKEKELENMTLINIEKEKYNQLEEKYNLEINEKNSHIRELTKNTNILSQNTTTGGISQDSNNIEGMQLEAIKNDYNDITNILVKYKILVSKLINDKDFFFEDILIDKTIGDLRKKYPEIFGLLSEKESLENLKIYYDKQMEILRNEIINLKEKNVNQSLEINELKEKLDETYKIIDDKATIIDSQTSMIKNKETIISGLEDKNKEFDIKFKVKIKDMQDNFKKEKILKDQEYIKEKQIYIKEIANLIEALDGLLSKQRTKFDNAMQNLSQDSQDKIKLAAINYKFK